MNNEYNCEKCGNSFVNKGNLNKHRKLNCKINQNNKKDEIKSFVCINCSKYFVRKDTLNRHIKENCKKKNILRPNMSETPIIETNTYKKDVDDIKHNVNNSTDMLHNMSIAKQTDPLMTKLITIIENQNKQIETQSKQIATQSKQMDKMSETLDRLENKEKNIINNNNTLNITINNYFNRDLDIHELVSMLKGRKWADNYILYTMHKECKYVEAIVDFLIKPDVDKSPIRLDNDGCLILHRSETEIERDINYQLLEKDTKNIMSLAYMKTFNECSTHEDKLFDALTEAHMVRKYDKLGLDKSGKHQSNLNNIHNKIFDGDSDCPPLKDFHINLEKINKYKISTQSKKNIESLLNGIRSK